MQETKRLQKTASPIKMGWQYERSYRNSSAMFVYRRESSLWTSLVPGGFTNKAAGTYYCEERVFEWIRLNREENIDELITGESGEAWRDGGCPKLRSISAAGEGGKNGGEKKHKNTGTLGGESVTPQNRCDDLWVEKTKHTLHPCSKNKGGA